MDGIGLRRPAHHLPTSPGNGANIGVRQVILVDHELFGGIDLGDRPWNLEIEHVCRVLQPLGMLLAPEDSAAIGALALEHAARIMQPVGQHMDVGVAPRHQFAVVPDDAIDFIERNSHGLSPGLTLPRASRRGAAGYAWPSPPPPLQPVSTSAWSLGHAFAEGGSPVCLPKCRSTIARSTNSRPSPPALAFSGRLKRHRGRNDLLFRCG